MNPAVIVVLAIMLIAGAWLATRSTSGGTGSACPSGTALDPRTGACVTPAGLIVCPSGTVLDPRTGACVTPSPPTGGWGPNVLIFTPAMSSAAITAAINAAYFASAEFAPTRIAIFFMPGTYALSFKVNYYMGVYGLGRTPDLTVINGTIQVCNNNSVGDPTNCHTGAPDPGIHALDNFWRACENLTIIPPASSGSTNFWAVSQACAMRRVIIQGHLHLSEDNGYSSGGFIADSVVTGDISFITQQQFILRNVNCGRNMSGGAWNIVLVGCQGARAADKITTVVPAAPIATPKPFIFYESGAYWIGVPNVRVNATGAPDFGDFVAISASQFIIATSTADLNAANAALAAGKHVVVAPGVYDVAAPLAVLPDSVLLGVGLATLRAGTNGAIVAHGPPDGARVGGFLLEATPATRTYLLDWGSGSASAAFAVANHSYLYDIYARVGGSLDPATSPISIPAMVHIGAASTVCDNFWLWVADHGVGIPPSGQCDADADTRWITAADFGDARDSTVRPRIAQRAQQAPQWRTTYGLSDQPPVHVLTAAAPNWPAIWKNLQCPTCLVVDADNVTCYGLAAEHATGGDLVKWIGDNGTVFFFQSEMPYHPIAGYNQVSFRGTGKNLTLQGGGAYTYFPCDNINLSAGFALPTDAHANVFTQFLNGVGGIAAVTSAGCGAAVHGPPGSPSSGPSWCRS
jgi:hypothetical protein